MQLSITYRISEQNEQRLATAVPVTKACKVDKPKLSGDEIEEQPMSLFVKHDVETAPNEAAAVLSAAKDRYGFVPNLAAYIAESPLALSAVLKLSELFEQSTLTAKEQQIVLLTVSTLNGCSYCKTAHTALALNADIGSDMIKNILALSPLENERAEALRYFTQLLVQEKGWVDSLKMKRFLQAGFSKAQAFEVVLGVSLKTMTNYCNHLAGAEPNEEFKAMIAGVEIV